jgi:hypothetical protein
MSPDNLIFCDGWEPVRKFKKSKRLSLSLSGTSANVTLRIGDISAKMAANIPDVLADLVEISTYVYCADQAVTRGGDGALNFGAGWRRRFHFFIPVRRPDVWDQADVREVLCESLSFLSEDTYEFSFTKVTNPRPMEQYFEFDGPERQLDEVVLFSGGLDSLGGVVQEAVVQKRSVALVSHRSSPKIDRKQRDLVADIIERCPANPPLHVPTWVHKEKALGREYTQRTRSFLYASLAVTVARMVGQSRIKFYENGLTTLNLPINEQVLGTRATRTTHPQALSGFARLFSLLLGQPFAIDSPFLWKTKAEIVNLIGEAGCQDLIKYSVSCMHTMRLTTLHTHCGCCSQCVIRRFATLASCFGEHDTQEMYKVDLLTDARNEGPDVTMLESFIRTAKTMELMTAMEFFSKFGEASRVLRHLPGSADQVATQILDLHKRFSHEVGGVLTKGIEDHAESLRLRKLPASCAISLACSDAYTSGQTRTVAAPRASRDVWTANGGSRTALSETDKKMLEMVGPENFQTRSNEEIQNLFRREIREQFRSRSKEAIRAILKRIRRHRGFPKSEEIKKIAVKR